MEVLTLGACDADGSAITGYGPEHHGITLISIEHISIRTIRNPRVVPFCVDNDDNLLDFHGAAPMLPFQAASTASR